MSQGKQNQKPKISLTLTADGKLRAISNGELPLPSVKKKRFGLKRLNRKAKTLQSTSIAKVNQNVNKPFLDEFGMPVRVQNHTLNNKHKNPALTPKPKPAKNKKLKNLRVIPKLSMPEFTKKRVLISLLVVIIFASGLYFYTSNRNKSVQVSTTVLGAKTIQPQFNTVLPANGTNKVSYDAQKGVASMQDKIGNVSITISEQTLPDNFKSDPNKELESLAKQIYANELIQAGEIKAYSGLSIKGPQTVVLVKDKLLIFMYANQKISSTDWANYIMNLK